MKLFKELDKLLDQDSYNEFYKTSSGKEKLNLQEGERRNVTILYADLKGFTSLSEILDPEQLREIADRILQLFTISIKKYGGYVDKYEGDLVMALFGAKKTTEQDTPRAISAGLSMIEKLKEFNHALHKIEGFENYSFQVRIGINSGLVTTGRVGEKREGDFTVYGDPVNLASRLESNAPANRIMITQATMEQVNKWFEFDNLTEIMVKGKSKPIPVCVVKNQKNKNFLSEDVHAPIMVGREKELNQIYEIYQKIGKQQDHFSVTVIGIRGKAGIGKTKFISEFLSKIGPRRNILWGEPPRYAQYPYCLFNSLLKNFFELTSNHSEDLEEFNTAWNKFITSLNEDDIFEELEDAANLIANVLGIKTDDPRLNLGTEERKIHLKSAIRLFLTALAVKENKSNNPLVIILEDLHLSDEISREILDYFLTCLDIQELSLDIMIVISYRDEFNLSSQIIDQSQFQEINLKPLGVKQLKILLVNLSKDQEMDEMIIKNLMIKSQGNPLYLREWIKLINNLKDIKVNELPLPDSLNALILSRIDQLPLKPKKLLQTLSVFGEKFSYDLVAKLYQKFDDGNDLKFLLEILTISGFIEKDLDFQSGQFSFTNILIQQVAYQSMLISNRKILHKLAAEIIEENYTEKLEDYIYQLADHYKNTDNKQKAMTYLNQAGQKAMFNEDYPQAYEFYSILNKFYQADGISITQLAVKKTPVDNNLKYYIEMLLDLYRVCLVLGYWQETERYLQLTVTYLESQKQSHLLGTAYNEIGKFLLQKGKIQEAIGCYKKAEKIFSDPPDPQQLFITYDGMGIAHTVQSEYQEALNYLQKNYKLAKTTNNLDNLSTVIGHIGIIHNMTGNKQKALKCFFEQSEISKKIQGKKGLSAAYGNIGTLFMETKKNRQALEYLEKDLHLCLEIGDKRGLGITYTNMGIVYFQLKKLEEALSYLNKAKKISEDLGDREGLAIAYGYLADVFCQQQNMEKAIEFINKSLELCTEINNLYFKSHFIEKKSEYLFTLNKISESEKAAIQSRDIAEEIQYYPAYISALSQLIIIKISKVEDRDSAEKLIDQFIKKTEKYKSDSDLQSTIDNSLSNINKFINKKWLK
ncbi:MAG: tetratricopeptide repeat protein [bacterium]